MSQCILGYALSADLLWSSGEIICLRRYRPGGDRKVKNGLAEVSKRYTYVILREMGHFKSSGLKGVNEEKNYLSIDGVD